MKRQNEIAWIGTTRGYHAGITGRSKEMCPYQMLMLDLTGWEVGDKPWRTGRLPRNTCQRKGRTSAYAEVFIFILHTFSCLCVAAFSHRITDFSQLTGFLLLPP